MDEDLFAVFEDESTTAGKPAKSTATNEDTELE